MVSIVRLGTSGGQRGDISGCHRNHAAHEVLEFHDTGAGPKARKEEATIRTPGDTRVSLHGTAEVEAGPSQLPRIMENDAFSSFKDNREL